MSTNAKLEAIGAKAAELLRSSMREASADILDEWDVAVDEAHANEKDPILSVAFTIKLDLGSNALCTSLGFSVRRKFDCVAEIPDPNQGELPMGDAAVTIKTGDGPPVKVTAADIAAAAKGQRLSKNRN